MLGRLIRLNKQMCHRLEPLLPQSRTNISGMYEDRVARYMNEKDGQIVADIGGGKFCPFAQYRQPGKGTKIIAVDIAEEEMIGNDLVDEKIVANVLKGLPFDKEEVDLIVSRFVLEHLEDVDQFIANARKSLKPGGYLIHIFPAKYAPFTVINQMLPNKIAKKVLYTLRPESQGIGGFPAFYDHCTASAIKNLLERHNFEVLELQTSYYQSHYFSFFVPFYLMSGAYELFVKLLGIKDLASYVLFVARKKE